MQRMFILALTVFLLAACGTLTDDVLTIRTADQGLTLHFRLLQPPPAPPIEPAVLPTITPTPCEPVVKGNINTQGEKIAHSPGQANYDNVVIDESKGEKLFCTLDEAVAEGWRPAQR